jgi:hypothetical protein
MTTRRERLENKLAKREEWAAGRRGKASALRSQNDRFRGDWAFNTQPGHIPERARAIARDEKSFEHLAVAEHHEEKAAGLAAQLDTAIFSDDSDAVESLQARIAEREAERGRYKAYNATCKAAAKRGEHHGDLALLSEAQRGHLLSLMKVCAYQVRPGGAFPAYVLSNLGANIRRDQERLKEVRRQAALRSRVEASTAGVVVEGSEWVSVTFAEKPASAVLDALRSAGFRWGSGSWTGKRENLPGCIVCMLGGF